MSLETDDSNMIIAAYCILTPWLPLVDDLASQTSQHFLRAVSLLAL
jgi:hypothetical protein